MDLFSLFYMLNIRKKKKKETKRRRMPAVMLNRILDFENRPKGVNTITQPVSNM